MFSVHTDLLKYCKASRLIYKVFRYGINWNLTEDTDFLGDTESKDEITVALGIDYSERDALFREYKTEQQALNARYKAYATAKGNYDNKAVYLFVLPEKGGQLGDMPIGKQWGYLFGAVIPQTQLVRMFAAAGAVSSSW